MEKWVFRTNLDHRNIRDYEPVLMGDNAVVQNSLVYNGCRIEGTVIDRSCFPVSMSRKGAVVENSVLFFNNVVGGNCRLNKVVADVKYCVRQ